MNYKNYQINYYIRGRKIFNQTGEADIQTIEANKIFLEEMFSIFHEDSEIEIIAELVQDLNNFKTKILPLDKDKLAKIKYIIYLKFFKKR